MAGESVTYNYEEPMSNLTGPLGGGPTMPSTITIAAAGSHDVAALGIPSTSNVTVYMAGASGGMTRACLLRRPLMSMA